jgi:hypothetical protein
MKGGTDDCSYCLDGWKPEKLSVITSDISICTNCFACHGQFYEVVDAPTVNGAWELSPYNKGANYCAFRSIAFTGVNFTMQDYYDAACTNPGAGSTLSTRSIEVYLEYANPNYIFAIRLYWPSLITHDWYFFEYCDNLGTSKPSCSIWDGIYNNDYSACCDANCFDNSAGYGGTATVSALGTIGHLAKCDA